MTDVTAFGALAAGVVSFLSPCVLPLVPGYISFISGLSLEELAAEGGGVPGARRKAFVSALGFVLGFALVFTALGASASAAGRLLEAYKGFFSTVAGVVIVLFGLHTMGALPIKWLYYEKRFQATGLPPGFLGALAMGVAFAFGWTPCIGPILAAILALAAREASVTRGMALLFVYSVGLGVPFLLTALATASFMAFFRAYKRYIVWGERAAGALLVVIGILIASDRLTMLIRFLPKSLYKFAM